MREVLETLVALGVGGILVHLRDHWGEAPPGSKGLYASLGDNVVLAPDESFRVETEACRREALAQLARTRCTSEVPESVPLADEERLVFSVRAVLYELYPSRRLLSRASSANSTVLWPARPGSGTRTLLSAVDAGSLLLTDHRFIFSSGRRQREFQLRELTHFSTIRIGVALAALGQIGVSFFTGINEQWIKVEWPVKVRSERVPSYIMRAMTGQDLEYLVQLLQSASTPPLT
jgi:hypothetical protein